MAKPLIAPSVLAADFSRLSEQVREVENAGADWLHLDIMDGRFVPNISFGPEIVKTLRGIVKIPLDVHLMIVEPERYLDSFRAAGADVITVHQEAGPHLHRTISRIRELGAKAGVSINPATPVSVLEDIAADVDLILIMSVNPGFGGQKFISNSIKRIADARALLNKVESKAYLQVDGGVDASTAPSVLAAGADVLVAGTSVFRQPDMKAAITALRNS